MSTTPTTEGMHVTMTQTPTTDVGVLYHLRAEQIGLHPDNIRNPARDIAALAASINEVGVIVPLVCVPATVIGADYPPEVEFVAVDGNRRLLAARTLAATLRLPAIVRDDLESAQATVSAMAAANLSRDGLTATETAKAVQEMLGFGMNQAAVARATGLPAKTVKQAKATSRLPDAALQAAGGYDLTLDQMAALSDFADDETLTDQLLTAAAKGPGQFANAVQQAIDDRKAERNRVKRTAELVKAGYTILEDRPTDGTDLTVPVRIDSLRLVADPAAAREALTLENHADCPGRGAYVTTLGWSTDVRVVAVCVNPAEHGHGWLYTHSQGGGVGGLGGSSSGRPAGPMNDAEKEERRTLIRRNKEMLAAQTVRRQFIHDTWKSSKHRKVLVAWALNKVIHTDRTYGRFVSNFQADAFIKIMGGDTEQKILAGIPEAQYPQLLWVQVCAAYEQEFVKDAWRRNSYTQYGSVDERAVYLEHLVSLGYTPCETEQLMIDQNKTPDGAVVEVDPDEDLDNDDNGEWDDEGADDDAGHAAGHGMTTVELPAESPTGLDRESVDGLDEFDDGDNV